MSYTKTNWENGATPAINADNLNKIEDELETLDAGLSSIVKTFTASIDISVSASAGLVVTGTKNISSLVPSGYTPVSAVLWGSVYKAAFATVTNEGGLVIGVIGDGGSSSRSYTAKVFCIKSSYISS